MKGLDTNVIVRFLVRDDEAQWLQADQYINKALENHQLCLINNIVLCEVVWVLRSRYKISRDQLITILESLLNTNIFRFENPDDIAWAIHQMKSGNADFSDYLIVRLNQRSGCDETSSFDVKLGQLSQVKLLGS
ncbi:MAG: type II toxin-antitoxin system VapC family toxin [Phormidium sp. PBR-2020]|nr:MAG: type II toxin-antitoxin system VapC family toxin [Phormidium sp. PBR-2020]